MGILKRKIEIMDLHTFQQDIYYSKIYQSHYIWKNFVWYLFKQDQSMTLCMYSLTIFCNNRLGSFQYILKDLYLDWGVKTRMEKHKYFHTILSQDLNNIQHRMFADM